VPLTYSQIPYADADNLTTLEAFYVLGILLGVSRGQEAKRGRIKLDPKG
jgi:hypothetical protein